MNNTDENGKEKKPSQPKGPSSQICKKWQTEAWQNISPDTAWLSTYSPKVIQFYFNISSVKRWFGIFDLKIAALEIFKNKNI